MRATFFSYVKFNFPQQKLKFDSAVNVREEDLCWYCSLILLNHLYCVAMID